MMTLQNVAPLAAKQGGSGLPFILFLGVMVVLFYFFLLRPQRNRQRQQQQLVSSVSPGARVMTTSGLYGTVVAVEDGDVVLEIAPGVESRFLKQAIMRLVEEDSAAEDDDPADDEPADADDVEESAAPAEDETTAAPYDQAEEKAEEKSPSKPSA